MFKSNVLTTIQLALIHGGRQSPHPVFIAGFGNRPTDVLAYASAGIDPAAIFLIDPLSHLKPAITTTRESFESYADPNVLLWLLPRLKDKVPLPLVDALDGQTAAALVEAEERAQIRQDSQHAVALQHHESIMATVTRTNSLSR
jgi:hypothetical protein